MNNSANIEEFKGSAASLLKGLQGLSVLLVGVMARDEACPETSDVDLIVFFDGHPIDLALFALLGRLRGAAESIFHMPISLQLITPDDLAAIIAPTLLPGYIHDGVVIFGEDIRENFKKQFLAYSPRERMLASLKRVLFERYFFRIGMTDDSRSKPSRHALRVMLSKRVGFILKELKNGFNVSAEDAAQKLGTKCEMPHLPVVPESFAENEQTG